MNNKKKNEGQTDFSYYGLYLLDYLRTNKFEQASDAAFIRERADRAAETYERQGSKAIPPTVRRSWRWTRCCAGCAIQVRHPPRSRGKRVCR